MALARSPPTSLFARCGAEVRAPRRIWHVGGQANAPWHVEVAVFDRHAQRIKRPIDWSAMEALADLNEDGTFKTAIAKEYAPPLCDLIACCFVDAGNALDASSSKSDVMWLLTKTVLPLGIFSVASKVTRTLETTSSTQAVCRFSRLLGEVRMSYVLSDSFMDGPFWPHLAGDARIGEPHCR